MLVFERRAEKRKEKPGKSLLTDNTEFSDFILVALWFVYILRFQVQIYSAWRFLSGCSPLLWLRMKNLCWITVLTWNIPQTFIVNSVSTWCDDGSQMKNLTDPFHLVPPDDSDSNVSTHIGWAAFRINFLSSFYQNYDSSSSQNYTVFVFINKCWNDNMTSSFMDYLVNISVSALC